MSNYKGQKISAVVPAYNEEETIGRVVTSLLSRVNQVFVVNDSSSDNTEKKANEAGATVINNLANLGYDSSINRGFEKAVENNSDIIITFDADGQHDVSDLDKLIIPIVNREVDIVIGRRKSRSSLGEVLFSIYTRNRFGVEDPLCGFKAYRATTYKELGYFDTLKSIGTQLLLESIKNGYKFRTVDIKINNRADTSRFYINRLRGNIRIIKALLRIIYRLEIASNTKRYE
ncbi:glycosyltransferase family 2 protein [Candidatus Kaiserbacteria bacterium]|nr:glycosyltransferase family 2 protein [Candidatus Kaiserbacteria bacterium]